MAAVTTPRQMCRVGLVGLLAGYERGTDVRIPLGARVALGVVGGVVLLAGLFVRSSPASFSSAETGDFSECEAGICRAYAIDDTGSAFSGDSDRPRTLLFEGTEAELNEWSDSLHADATRSRVITFLAAGGVMLVLALIPIRRRASGSR